MDWQERIIVDPKILGGKPVIKGTLLAADFIIELLSLGWAEAEILRNYPDLTHEDIIACLKYNVVLEESDDGGYTVHVASLPGCVSEGDTKEEALENIHKAIELYLEP
jgi:uncharacterized protein (DUF433 family)